MNKHQKILVTGGAGYIGSFTAHLLKKKGFEVVIFDNLEYGHPEAAPDFKLIKGNLVTDKKLLEKVCQQEKFAGVIHFAAYALAGESMEKPEKYFINNVYGTLNLLEAMREAKVNKIVFSSTCAVYGQPEKLPIVEEEKKEPESPYGESKLMIEKILSWYGKIYGLHSLSLRYFNAAGAAFDGSIGEDHQPETHLIPLACQVALGKRKKLVINGDDYPTPDGTCIRDYIHVLDLAEIHLLALGRLEKKKKTEAFNVGTGKGYSVKEVAEMVKKTSGINFKAEIGPRRPGDPAQLFADNTKIKKEFSWQPQYSDLKTIVKSAWQWHRSHPEGYQG